MTHDGECDMVIYVPKLKCQHEAKPECWHFNFGTYIILYLHVTRVHHGSFVLSRH